MRKSGVKKVIFDIWEANLDWSPKEIKSAVHKELGGKRSKNNTYPGLRTVQQYVAEFKANLGQLVDEDKPWSIAASVKYGLPPEATKDLFDIWRASLAMGSPISIRQVKWIVHIRNLFYTISTGNAYSDKVNRNLWLIRQSWLYSIMERASRIMGEKHFDTTNLDAASFMSPLEHTTALKLGKVTPVHYSQEALAKLEKRGTSLTSPPVSVRSVEDAVWHKVMAKPPPQLEVMAIFTPPDDVLPEQYDLVAAYWLTHLSKGPLWNNLPEQPDIRARLEYFRRERKRQRESGGLVLDSGGFPDDSLYSRQLSVRHRLLDWVKTDSIRRRLLHPVRTGSVIEEVQEMMKADLPSSPPFNATLLKTVGYEVTSEQLENWLKLRKAELLAQHKGFNRLATELQQRFIHDEQTYDDLKALEDADNEVLLKQKQLELEFIELVQQKGGVPDNKKGYKIVEDFWVSISDEWVKKYPEYEKDEYGFYLQWEQVQAEYERIIEEQKKEAQNER